VNLLAHAYLSGTREEVLVGNLVGDFYKGHGFLKHDNYLFKEGILLHRFIDDFTDKHPRTHFCKKLLWNKYRHYSGVLVDIFYDHFLAKNWKDYSSITLNEFTQKTYAILSKHSVLIPEKAAYMIDHMTTNNWFESYQSMEGIQKTLHGMSRRTKYVSGMELASQDLYLMHDEFEKQFKSFFPDIAAECHKIRSKYE
jgi:acyl carrier protein phosphodiesterase